MVMHKKYLAAIFIVLSVLIFSCRKKHLPETAAATTVNSTATSTGKKTVVRKMPRTPVPKVIIVDDRAARKTVDGRLYHDLESHRYWRNNKDGKYYLFNKSMYADSAYKTQ